MACAVWARLSQQLQLMRWCPQRPEHSSGRLHVSRLSSPASWQACTHFMHRVLLPIHDPCSPQAETTCTVRVAAAAGKLRAQQHLS